MPSVDRVRALLAHLTPSPPASTVSSFPTSNQTSPPPECPFGARLPKKPTPLDPARRKTLANGTLFPLLSRNRIRRLADRTLNLEYDISKHLAGPLQDPSLSKEDVLMEIALTRQLGNDYALWTQYQDKYGDRGMNTNIVLPVVVNEPGRSAFIDYRIILSDANDCERIASTHVKKDRVFQLNGLNHSIISTNDNQYWKKQRDHFTPAFMPMSSLAKIFPITDKRASKCAVRLGQLAAADPKREVDVNDFFLHETQAQLQLALFGETEEFMEKTNKALRQGFAQRHEDPLHVGKFLNDQVDRAKADAPNRTSPEEARKAGCPVKGPLAKLMVTLDDSRETQLGNAFIFAFAGHDTTGHTLTWLARELAKHPDKQAKLQAEVDGFWASRGRDAPADRALEYTELKQLPYMTRCIVETLRLWPAVVNGTFREMQFDDVVTGPGGKQVTVLKGTLVQVTNWARHRNPDLWGPDVNEFNPERAFTDKELWYHRGLSAQNPATARFSPFTYKPRDCIGKNFAHMEMRAILLYVLRTYKFALIPGEPLPKDEEAGMNVGTMGPRQTRSKGMPFPKSDGLFRAFTGLHLRVLER